MLVLHRFVFRCVHVVDGLGQRRRHLLEGSRLLLGKRRELFHGCADFREGIADGARLLFCRFDVFRVLCESLVHRVKLTAKALDFVLNRRELGANLFDGFFRLHGELPDFFRDDSEAASVLAGARRFDGGVQGEKVRLFGNTVDRCDEGVDVRRGTRQRIHALHHETDAVADDAVARRHPHDRFARCAHRFLPRSRLLGNIG